MRVVVNFPNSADVLKVNLIEFDNNIQEAIPSVYFPSIIFLVGLGLFSFGFKLTNKLRKNWSESDFNKFDL